MRPMPGLIDWISSFVTLCFVCACIKKVETSVQIQKQKGLRWCQNIIARISDRRRLTCLDSIRLFSMERSAIHLVQYIELLCISPHISGMLAFYVLDFVLVCTRITFLSTGEILLSSQLRLFYCSLCFC